jgi:hypothetical protein
MYSTCQLIPLVGRAMLAARAALFITTPVIAAIDYWYSKLGRRALAVLYAVAQFFNSLMDQSVCMALKLFFLPSVSNQMEIIVCHEFKCIHFLIAHNNGS